MPGIWSRPAVSHRSNRTIALTTLGCKVNQADSDAWLRTFVARGYDVVDFDQAAIAARYEGKVLPVISRRAQIFLRPSTCDP